MWIILAVLVPFAVLVALGFYFSPSEPPLRAERGEGRGEGPTPAPLPVNPHPDPLPKGEGTSSVTPPSAPELPPELQPLLPEVKRCFADQHFKTRHEVKVRYTPTRDGGFQDVQVDEQNPYLAACLEDVFAELTWQPDGGQPFAPATHTFSFGPSPD